MVMKDGELHAKYAKAGKSWSHGTLTTGRALGGSDDHRVDTGEEAQQYVDLRGHAVHHVCAQERVLRLH
eukprot:11058814-Heterocapsa_arctica.AAC.1